MLHGCAAPWRLFFFFLFTPAFATKDASFTNATSDPTHHGSPLSPSHWTSDLRATVREMFYHGYDSYMTYAFPSDEIKPLSCKGRDRPTKGNTNPRGHLDDPLGNYALTLIDSLDTLIVLGDYNEFQRAVSLVIDHVSFDNNVTVNLFEATIRVLGGLLSAHVLAVHKLQKDPFAFDDFHYDHQLLDMAVDLGFRLLPAFDTPTGIPYSRINLQNGVPPGETLINCLAGAGTLTLEFAALSRLSQVPVFEESAKKAVEALWERRSTLNLLGGAIDVSSGKWTNSLSSLGAGSDSFYEYLLKTHVLLGDEKYLDMFNMSLQAIDSYMRRGDVYLPVYMESGALALNHIESLSAYWPGLLVLGGHVSNAVKAHMPYYKLWRRFGALPEVYDVLFHKMPPSSHSKGYPLRPEFAESTYSLFQATRNPFYLEVGEEIIRALEKTRVACGFASVADVSTGRLDDRMDSYFLSETCKYLYLLFDSDNEFNDNENYVFTTEGHLLPVLPHRCNSAATSDMMCPATFVPPSIDAFGDSGVREEVQVVVHEIEEITNGVLEVSTERAETVRHLIPVEMEWGVVNVIASLKPTTYQNTFLRLVKKEASGPKEGTQAGDNLYGPDVVCRDQQCARGPTEQSEEWPEEPQRSKSAEQDFTFKLHLATFGPDIVEWQKEYLFAWGILEEDTCAAAEFDWGREKGSPLLGFDLASYPYDACGSIDDTWAESNNMKGKIVLVPRGNCTFVHKANTIAEKGAIAMIVISNNNDLFAMTKAPKESVSIPCVMMGNSDGSLLSNVVEKWKAVSIAPSLVFGRAFLDSVQVEITMLRHVLTKFARDNFSCKGTECGAFIKPETSLLLELT